MRTVKLWILYHYSQMRWRYYLKRQHLSPAGCIGCEGRVVGGIHWHLAWCAVNSAGHEKPWRRYVDGEPWEIHEA